MGILIVGLKIHVDLDVDIKSNREGTCRPNKPKQFISYWESTSLF